MPRLRSVAPSNFRPPNHTPLPAARHATRLAVLLLFEGGLRSAASAKMYEVNSDNLRQTRPCGPTRLPGKRSFFFGYEPRKEP